MGNECMQLPIWTMEAVMWSKISSVVSFFRTLTEVG
jgi:hypothetical protein